MFRAISVMTIALLLTQCANLPTRPTQDSPRASIGIGNTKHCNYIPRNPYSGSCRP